MQNKQTLTATIAVRNAGKAIEFYKSAFGAEELLRVPGKDGRIHHSKLQIGNSIFFLSDEFPEMPDTVRAPETLTGTTCAFYLYVNDADEVFTRSVKAGAVPLRNVADQIWGDREGLIRDSFGHLWAIAMHKDFVSDQEIKQRQLKESE